jgi:hypothetical protein
MSSAELVVEEPSVLLDEEVVDDALADEAP